MRNPYTTATHHVCSLDSPGLTRIRRQLFTFHKLNSEFKALFSKSNSAKLVLRQLIYERSCFALSILHAMDLSEFSFLLNSTTMAVTTTMGEAAPQFKEFSLHAISHLTNQSHIRSLLNSTAVTINVALGEIIPLVKEQANQAIPQLMQHVQKNPKSTALTSASLITWYFGGAAALAGTMLKSVGFGSAGPVAGT